MCGIVAILQAGDVDEASLRRMCIEMSKKIRHRGPDWSGVHVTPQAPGTSTCTAIGHERLAIMDPDSGAQPLFNADKTVCLAVNGEIYNYKELKASLKKPFEFKTESDCEVIVPLYEEHGEGLVKMLDGMFAFVLHDARTQRFLIARDHIGIIPLYYGWGADGSLCVASELKALKDRCVIFNKFSPGHYMTESSNNEPVPYYTPKWHAIDDVPSAQVGLPELREALCAAVRKRMMADVQWGVLLSGGLDSSLIASIAVREWEAQDESQNGPKLPIHSFCIGLEGSPDLVAAAKVAKFLNTKHHSYTFTLEEGLDAVSDVIYHLETFDTTTIRAATPMFLMSRKIKAHGVKMVLSGEGADEVFGGYLYFHKAPSPAEFHKELVRKLKDLHNFDCLRANKSTSAWGVEARVPFLDRAFLDVAMGMDPAQKACGALAEGRMEKHVLRAAFDTPDRPYLPKEVLWRQKEQFSDGVGYGWIDMLRDHAEKHVSDSMFAKRDFLFPGTAPATKEAYYYRTIFSGHFPQASAAATVPCGPSIACSTAAAIEWDKRFKEMAMSSGGDCSGRAVEDVHTDAYDDALAEAAGQRSKAAAAAAVDEGKADGDDAGRAKKQRVA